MTENATLEAVATELGIDLDAPALTDEQAEAARVETLRSAMVEVSGELGKRSVAKRKLTEVGHPDLFDAALASLQQLIAVAEREQRELVHDFVETVLVPLAEEALPQTKYPWLYALSCCAGYDAASAKYWLRTYSEWCDANPAHVDAWTVADLSNPNTLRDGELCKITTIHDTHPSTLVDIESWLNKRLEGRRESARKATAKKERQKALKAVNRSRKAEGKAALPDPDTKAGRDEIARLGREASSYSFNKLQRDSVKNQTPEQTAAHQAEYERLTAIANEAIYGNAAGESPHELYKTSRELTSRF